MPVALLLLCGLAFWGGTGRATLDVIEDSGFFAPAGQPTLGIQNEYPALAKRFGGSASDRNDDNQPPWPALLAGTTTNVRQKSQQTANTVFAFSIRLPVLYPPQIPRAPPLV